MEIKRIEGNNFTGRVDRSFVKFINSAVRNSAKNKMEIATKEGKHLNPDTITEIIEEGKKILNTLRLYMSRMHDDSILKIKKFRKVSDNGSVDYLDGLFIENKKMGGVIRIGDSQNSSFNLPKKVEITKNGDSYSINIPSSIENANLIKDIYGKVTLHGIEYKIIDNNTLNKTYKMINLLQQIYPKEIDNLFLKNLQSEILENAKDISIMGRIRTFINIRKEQKLAKQLNKTSIKTEVKNIIREIQKEKAIKKANQKTYKRLARENEIILNEFLD